MLMLGVPPSSSSVAKDLWIAATILLTSVLDMGYDFDLKSTEAVRFYIYKALSRNCVTSS